jgi:hypothetical protein
VLRNVRLVLPAAAQVGQLLRREHVIHTHTTFEALLSGAGLLGAAPDAAALAGALPAAEGLAAAGLAAAGFLTAGPPATSSALRA